MALIWADNFAMYGDQSGRLTDGIYAEYSAASLNSGVNPGIRIAGGGPGNHARIRYALPGNRTTVGQGGYIYMDNLPTSNSLAPCPITWKSAANAFLYSVCIRPNGSIQVCQGLNGTAIGSSSGPVVTASSEIHIEAKMVQHPTDGSIEVRVRGRTVIKLEGINTGTVPIGQVAAAGTNDGAGGATSYIWRHWTIWDDQGTINNNFLGQVQVFWNDPVENITDGGWTSNAGASAKDTLDKPRLANRLLATGNLANNNQVRIANTYYVWTTGDVDASTPAGTSTNPWRVAIGATVEEGMSNLYQAINGSGTPGVTYSTSLVEHPSVKGFGLLADSVYVIPKIEGVTSMTFSESGSNTAWESTTAFLDRVWDGIQMSAGYISGDPVTYPDAFKVKLRTLPDDVTSIRAVLPIVRAAKIDGGDGNIQVSFGTSEDSYDNGPDTPITNAFTYWGNATDPFVSEINPETGLPWTPSEFNIGARIKVQRTK